VNWAGKSVFIVSVIFALRFQKALGQEPPHGKER